MYLKIFYNMTYLDFYCGIDYMFQNVSLKITIRNCGSFVLIIAHFFHLCFVISYQVTSDEVGILTFDVYDFPIIFIYNDR